MRVKIEFNDDKKIIVMDNPEATTFSNWKLKEENIEEFISKNLDLILGEDNSYLLVGRQVMDANRKRNDLLAIDNNGSLVLIEVKRDVNDIKARSEELEFQSIRYVSSIATIKDPDDLINKSFAKYIEKYNKNAIEKGLTSFEFASRELTNFLNDSECLDTFNLHQRIVLIASNFDDETKSACAWLIKNGVDITLIRLIP